MSGKRKAGERLRWLGGDGEYEWVHEPAGLDSDGLRSLQELLGLAPPPCGSAEAHTRGPGKGDSAALERKWKSAYDGANGGDDWEGVPVKIEHRGSDVGKVVSAWKHNGRMDLQRAGTHGNN